MEKQYLAILDLDGTLFDTGNVNYHSYKGALEPFGILLDREYFLTNCNGKHYTEFLPQIMGSAEHIEEVHQAKKELYWTNLDKSRKNMHLFEVVKAIQGTYHTAVVTTASRKNAVDILQYFGHEDLFEWVVTQEDITRAKPDPEGFLLAIKHFGVRPEDTIIFEDSDVGIQAARAAGAAVMVVDRF